MNTTRNRENKGSDENIKAKLQDTQQGGGHLSPKSRL